MDRGTVTTKYVVLTFNTFCALSGIIYIVFATLVPDEPEGIDNICMTIIVFGSILFLTAFFGCCGVKRQSERLMQMYATLLTILIIVDIVCISIAYRQLESEVEAELELAWDNGKSTDEMALFETTFQCCGIEGPNDYLHLNMTIPDSCYVNTDKEENLQKDGCLEKIMVVVKIFRIIIWVSLSIKAVTLISVLYLGTRFRNLEPRPYSQIRTLWLQSAQ